MPNLTGQSIGRYHILEQLGEGGMAIVYKAYDTRLERNVALKVLRTDLFGSAIIEQILKRFEREAKSLAKLSHPNIVNILDYGEHEGMPYLVMEYLPGGTLKQKLGHVIPWQEAIRTLLLVANGLAYAHQRNIIHRDVKPANILMSETNRPILTDFGIAKLLEGADGHTLTASGVGIGTPEYMAPEQGIGASTIDARADIYSLGIVLYEMVTGRKPYIADTPMAVVLKQMTDPLPRPSEFVPNLPESVEHILFKALAKQPDDRYADMNAFIESMEVALSEAHKIDIPTSIQYRKKKAKFSLKPGRILVGTFSAIAIIILGGVAIPRIRAYFSPASTNTLSPTITRTITPTPTLTTTPTRTPLPTPTGTPDFRRLNPENQHLYLYVKQNKNWQAARNYCDSVGGHLVTIQNASENQYISKLVYDHIWLGATDVEEEGSWKWITGERWDYTNWGRGEPNDEGFGEDYLELTSDMLNSSTFSKTWNDLSSKGPWAFVCEWDSATP